MRLLAYSWPLLLALVPYHAQINPTVYGTVSLLEIIWITINAPGAAYSLINFLESRVEMKLARSQEPPNADDVESAGYVRRNERLIFILQFGNFLIGILSALTPPPIVPQVSVAGMIVQLGLISTSFLLTYTSVKNRYARRLVNRSILKKEVDVEARNKERDTLRDLERDAGRDIDRDVDRDVSRDVGRDTMRDIGHDAAVANENGKVGE